MFACLAPSLQVTRILHFHLESAFPEGFGMRCSRAIKETESIQRWLPFQHYPQHELERTDTRSRIELVDAAIAVLYYVLGASYGVMLGGFSLFSDPKLKKEAKETVNGVKDDLQDGAYDIKAR